MAARDTATDTDEDLVPAAAGIAGLRDADSAAATSVADFVAKATGVSEAAVKVRAAADSTARLDHMAVKAAFMAVRDRTAVATGNRVME
jgi:hypothetical protein